MQAATNESQIIFQGLHAKCKILHEALSDCVAIFPFQQLCLMEYTAPHRKIRVGQAVDTKRRRDMYAAPAQSCSTSPGIQVIDIAIERPRGDRVAHRPPGSPFHQFLCKSIQLHCNTGNPNHKLNLIIVHKNAHGVTVRARKHLLFHLFF